MQAERPFGAIYDQLERVPVNKLPNLARYSDELGPGFKRDVDEYFKDLFGIMLECIIAEMNDVIVSGTNRVAQNAWHKPPCLNPSPTSITTTALTLVTYYFYSQHHHRVPFLL